MRHLPVLILMTVATLLSVTTFTGCGGTVGDDARLVAADSLLSVDADSALALVESLSRDSLPREGDRAYRDLLVTQARYKCYITATSDSDINRALGYYRAHSGDQEKLTRAYIYKGAVMEELGYPDSAMFYYKHAEATADPDDYFNLGYVKMRIATLYQEELSQDTVPIILLKEAIRYFTIVNDTNYLISCYGDLGALCGVKRPDSTEYYLINAIHLAQQSKNAAKQYTYESKLAGFNLYCKKDYRMANLLSMDVLRNGSDQSYETQFYYYAALSFVKLGLVDSAKYVLSVTPAPVDRVDSMNYHKVVAEIAKAKDDQISYGNSLRKSYEKEVLIVSDKQDAKLKMAENKYHTSQLENHVASVSRSNHLLTIILSILFILTLLLICLTLQLRRSNRKKDAEMNDLEHTLVDTISGLEEKQRNLDQTQRDLVKRVSYRIDALRELFNSIKFKSKGKEQNVRRTIVSLSSVIRGLNEIYQPLKIELSADFWEKMRVSVDDEYNGIVSYVESHYPLLTQKELRLFTMLCAKISPQIIKMCLNYTHVNSVTNNRRIIINKKMGLDMSFESFVDKYMKNEL